MNIFKLPQKELDEELIQDICSGRHVRVERIVSTGQVSPPGFWYNQAQDELVILLQGNAEIEFEDGNIKLCAGDTLMIPAHKKHRVAFTSSCPACIWLCIFADFAGL